MHCFCSITIFPFTRLYAAQFAQTLHRFASHHNINNTKLIYIIFVGQLLSRRVSSAINSIILLVSFVYAFFLLAEEGTSAYLLCLSKVDMEKLLQSDILYRCVPRWKRRRSSTYLFFACIRKPCFRFFQTATSTMVRKPKRVLCAKHISVQLKRSMTEMTTIAKRKTRFRCGAEKILKRFFSHSPWPQYWF